MELELESGIQKRTLLMQCQLLTSYMGHLADVDLMPIVKHGWTVRTILKTTKFV